MPVTHLLNAEFDLELRPRPRWRERARLVRQVRELSLQGMLGAAAGDRVLVAGVVPGAFAAYLEGNGIPVPEARVGEGSGDDPPLRPYGWTPEAMERSRRSARPVRHPDLTVLRRVNGRRFARELEERLPSGAPTGGVLRDPADLERFLASGSPGDEWVLKAEHGNSGLANRRVRGRRPSAADLRFLEEILTEDDAVVIERWLPRERDWCAVFEAPFDPGSFRVHEMINTAEGALVGALFEPGEAAPPAVREELLVVAGSVGEALEEAGYFGPVCLDAFQWRDGERLRLRPLVDLNARRSMSDGAHRLWRRIAPDRTLFYRFLGRRRLSLPSCFGEAVESLGGDRYDPDRREGILFLSPFAFGEAGARTACARLAVAFAAVDRKGVQELESRFRTRYEGAP